MQSVKNKISGWAIWHGINIDDDLVIGVWELFMDIDFKLTENIKMPLLFCFCIGKSFD